MVQMENNQITIDDLIKEKSPIKTKQQKRTSYFNRMERLERQVAKLEKEILIIIQSLRR